MTDQGMYQTLRKQYPSALGYYLQAVYNPVEIERVFIDGNDVDSMIGYPRRQKQELVERLQKLTNDLSELSIDFTLTHSFIEHRMRETEFLLAQLHSIEDGELTTDYQRLNVALFGALDKATFDTIVTRTSKKRWPTPDGEIFTQNVLGLREAARETITQIKQSLDWTQTVEQAVTHALDAFGMTELGWIVVVDEGRAGCVVAPQTHKLILGSTIMRTTDHARVVAILAHELTHVLRAKHSTIPVVYTPELRAFEEGLAHFVEREARGKRISVARYWRYLAIGLAQGLDGGKARTARQVYDLLVPLYAKRNPNGNASHYVFGTVLRVWKGMPLSMPGAVMNKDLRYAQGSLLLWRLLASHSLLADDFSRLFTHKVLE